MWIKRIFDRERATNPLFGEVYLRQLERLTLRTVPRLRGARWGERRSRNARPAFEFVDHRPYSGGDDLRHVDWKVFGRHEELFVKLGEATQSLHIHILLDGSPSMSWKPDWDRESTAHKWDGARRLAGALGYISLAGGERVVVTPFATGNGNRFGPAHGKRQAIGLLDFLSHLQTGGDKAERAGLDGLAYSLHVLTQYHPQGGVLVLISDLLDVYSAERLPHLGDEKEGPLSRALRPVATPRWQVMVLHYLHRQEVAPSLEGDVDLRDLETGDRLPFSLDSATLVRYRERVEVWSESLRTACAESGATYAQVLADWPLEATVVPYLRQRGVFE